MDGKSFKLTLAAPTRQSRLAAWFELYGVDRAAVAKALGVTRQMVSKICRAETAPAHQLDKMKAMGFPPYLLPQPTPGNGKGAVEQ